MTKLFIFRQSNRSDWEDLTSVLNTSIFDVKRGFKKDFEVEIRELKKKRSGQQLKAYWVLVISVLVWMNEKGNTFTSHQVSDWFKIQAGHCSEIEGQLIPKSISGKSDCTKEQMQQLINIILVFGAENLIDGCEIEDLELAELLNYYK